MVVVPLVALPVGDYITPIAASAAAVVSLGGTGICNVGCAVAVAAAAATARAVSTSIIVKFCSSVVVEGGVGGTHPLKGEPT